MEDNTKNMKGWYLDVKNQEYKNKYNLLLIIFYVLYNN